MIGFLSAPITYDPLPITCLLSKTAGDVVFGAFVGGVGENLGAGVHFDEVAEQEEAGFIRAACGLLHVVGDDDDGEALFEFAHQLFDF